MLALQRDEHTEKLVYERLANAATDQRNRQVLARIARDEESHYRFWMRYTGQEVTPNRVQAWLYFVLSKIFGLTFGLKLMEQCERRTHRCHDALLAIVPEAKKVFDEEERHEQELIDLVDDERLRYVGSVVLGLNDALVELTGALAGLSFALPDARLVAAAGIIMGTAAALSMAASQYLSIKSGADDLQPLKASIYTGAAYLLTVLSLVTPYVFLSNLRLCLGIALLNAIIIISLFSFYIAIAREMSFKRRFLEMRLLGLGVSAISFGIGVLVKTWLRVEA